MISDRAVTDERKPVLLVLASTYPRWRDDPEPGFVHELCRRLIGKFDVIAVVPDSPGADTSGMLDGVRVVRYRYAPRRLQSLVNNGGIVTNLRRSPWKYLLVPSFVLGQYLAARKQLATRKVDVVHAHWLIPQGFIARRLKTPYLVTSHGGDLFGLRGSFLTALKRKVAESCSAMTVVSSAMKIETETIGLQPKSLSVLPMGVDMQSRFTVDPTILRNADSLLFVGRLVPKKGLRLLLEALPAVLKRRPHTVLKIVGFGPEESSLKDQAHRLGLASNVQFAGATSQAELPAIYRSASVFVAPFIRDDSGNQEGLPVVMMEAIGCGCPVIVGDVDGINDLVGDFSQEVCVNSRDSNALASAIINVLENPRRAQERALLMRAQAVHRVDWQSIAYGYAELLESCRNTSTRKNQEVAREASTE